MTFYLELEEKERGLKLDAKDEKRDASDVDAWQKILVSHPALVDSMANFEVCRDACLPKKLTLERFELLITIPKFVESLIVAIEPGEIRSRLIAQIVENIDDPIVAKHRCKLLAFWPIERLREELVRVESVTNLRDKSNAELRQIAKQGRPEFVAGWPKLPDEILVGGQMIEVTSQFIKGLHRDRLVALIRRFGADQVNAILNGGRQ